LSTPLALALCASLDLTGCGSDGSGSEFQSTGDGTSSGQGASGTTGSSVPRGADPNAPSVIRGGGSNSAPLGSGCGPETANECHPVGGNCNPATLAPDYRLIEAESVCFYSESADDPAAVVEYVTEYQNGKEYVHLRVTFDPAFVDTAYGECSTNTGWTPKKPGKKDEDMEAEKPGHTFKDLVGSDHVEVMLYDCADELAMHLKLDFIAELESNACGYASGGATEGDGKVIVGSADHVLAASSSLSRNMNGCGYCETENSPCTDEYYATNPDAPEWDFRVYYEVWIDAEAFGDLGMCLVDVDSVHASPSKADDNTVLVEPKDCPPPPGGPCPPNHELYLTSEGEELCKPPDQLCPEGYVIDLTSEGEDCIEDS
jgi:hypothetical protein